MYCTKIGKVDLYYEIDNKTIGRMPSNSNLKTNGSDNSLYLGMKKNVMAVDYAHRLAMKVQSE